MASVEINRREAILGGASALATLYASGLSAETVPTDIDRIKDALATDVITELEKPYNEQALKHVRTKKFWGIDEPGNVPNLKEKLIGECNMYVPGLRLLGELRSRCGAKLQESITRLPNGEYARFVDGDFSRDEPKKEQTGYLVRNNGGTPQILMAAPVSLSFADYSDRKGSEGTPLGKQTVKRIVRGLFGQVVSNSVSPDAQKEWIQRPVEVDGRRSIGWFPKSIVRGDRNAAMTSAVLWIDENRTIGDHGSNKTAGLGYPGSTGCIRESNMVLLYMLNFLKVGSPIMIHGTPLTSHQRELGKVYKGLKFN